MGGSHEDGNIVFSRGTDGCILGLSAGIAQADVTQVNSNGPRSQLSAIDQSKCEWLPAKGLYGLMMIGPTAHLLDDSGIRAEMLRDSDEFIRAASPSTSAAN